MNDLQEILKGAPDDATHWDGDYLKRCGDSWFYFDYHEKNWRLNFEVIDMRSLADLREIVALRAENVELRNTINARNQMINEMSHLIAKEQAENERMQTFIRQHCVKWGGVAEMQPSIDVLKRCLAKGES